VSIVKKGRKSLLFQNLPLNKSHFIIGNYFWKISEFRDDWKTKGKVFLMIVTIVQGLVAAFFLHIYIWVCSYGSVGS